MPILVWCNTSLPRKREKDDHMLRLQNGCESHSSEKSNVDNYIESLHDIDEDETQLLPTDCVLIGSRFETNTHALSVFTNGGPKYDFIMKGINKEVTVPSLPPDPSSESSLKRAATTNPFQNSKHVASGLPTFDHRMRNCVLVC
jgi:hypothetical protein